MGLFRNLTDSFGLTRRETLNLDVAGAFNPIEFVNDILGVSGKREEFTRADGTKGTRFVAGGSTPEMQAFAESLTNDIQSLVGDITELSQLGAAIDNDAFDPVVNAVRENQKDSREQAFRSRSRLEEETLAKRGLEDSTSSIEARQQRGADLQGQQVQDERDLVLLAEQLRDQQIQRSGVGLGAAQTERNTLATGAENQRSNSINLATGQQQLTLGAQQANFNDRTSANQQQANAFTDTASMFAGGFSGGLGGAPTGTNFLGGSGSSSQMSKAGFNAFLRGR